jgi:hypothetical protein
MLIGKSSLLQFPRYHRELVQSRLDRRKEVRQKDGNGALPHPSLRGENGDAVHGESPKGQHGVPSMVPYCAGQNRGMMSSNVCLVFPALKK